MNTYKRRVQGQKNSEGIQIGARSISDPFARSGHLTERCARSNAGCKNENVLVNDCLLLQHMVSSFSALIYELIMAYQQWTENAMRYILQKPNSPKRFICIRLFCSSLHIYTICNSEFKYVVIYATWQKLHRR